jgi:hypothetical protein
MSTLDDDLFALDEQLHRDGYDADGTFRRALHRLQMRRHNDRVAALASQVEALAGSPNTLLARLQALDSNPNLTMHDYAHRLYWTEIMNEIPTPARRWKLFVRAPDFFKNIGSPLPGGLRTMLVATFDSSTVNEPPVLDHEAAEGKPDGFHLYAGEPFSDPTQLNNSNSARVAPTVPAAPTDTAEP